MGRQACCTFGARDNGINDKPSLIFAKWVTARQKRRWMIDFHLMQPLTKKVVGLTQSLEYQPINTLR